MNKQQELLAQKRSGNTGITLNAYSRKRLEDALRATGGIFWSGESKTDIWKRVLSSPAATKWLLETRGW